MVTGSSTARVALRYTSLSALLVVMIFPLLWMFRVALAESAVTSNLNQFLSGSFTLSNIGDLLLDGILLRPLINSAIVVVAVTIGNLLFCLMTGYMLARYQKIEGKLLFAAAIGVLMIPLHVTIIPLYLLCLKLGIFDSYLALILPFLVQPIGIFLMKQFIENIPPAMEEAARIDGASEMTILFRVVMPMCKPALAVLAIQIFFTNWNSFLFPFILTSRSELHTLPVALATLQGHQAIDWPHLMAGSTIAVLPVLVLFIFLQRQIVSGITAGAIKQ